MRFISATACAVALLACAPVIAGCNTVAGALHLPVDHQTAEKAMIDCDTAYVAIVTVVQALPADKQALGKDIQAKAWTALQIARGLYAANQAPSAASFAGLLAQAQAL